MKQIVIAVLVIGMALGAVYPGASASVAISSINNLVKGLTPLIVPSVITTDTILLDNRTFSNILGRLVIKDVHL